MEEAAYALGDEAFGILQQVRHLCQLPVSRQIAPCKLEVHNSFCPAARTGSNMSNKNADMQVRKYIDQEIRSEINQLPTFEDGLALNVIRYEARRCR